MFGGFLHLYFSQGRPELKRLGTNTIALALRCCQSDLLNLGIIVLQVVVLLNCHLSESLKSMFKDLVVQLTCRKDLVHQEVPVGGILENAARIGNGFRQSFH